MTEEVIMDRVAMAVDSPSAEIGARVGGAVALLACWRDRARQRRQLAQLDARQRADIGITRCDVARECAKPFWRA
jgi:uncharacterized protein YjiS (DUF1127 family)